MSDRALLIGINRYRDVSGLRGCLNDVRAWHRLLVDVAGFDPAGIRTLTDADASKPNVLSHLTWLAEGAGTGDRLVLQFSGHGSFTVDTDGDEGDGYDELLCLHGYPDEYLLDDELGDWIATVDEAVDLTVVMDCCHAGTITREVPAPPDSLLAPSRGPLAIVGPGAGVIDPACLDPTSPACRLARFAPPPPEIATHPAAPPPPGALSAAPRAPRRRLIERAVAAAPDRAILLAACRADQTSADAHLGGDFFGAFSYFATARLTRAGKAGLGRSALIKDVAQALRQGGFAQVPQYEAARPRSRVLGPPRAAGKRGRAHDAR